MLEDLPLAELLEPPAPPPLPEPEAEGPEPPHVPVAEVLQGLRSPQGSIRDYLPAPGPAQSSPQPSIDFDSLLSAPPALAEAPSLADEVAPAQPPAPKPVAPDATALQPQPEPRQALPLLESDEGPAPRQEEPQSPAQWQVGRDAQGRIQVAPAQAFGAKRQETPAAPALSASSGPALSADAPNPPQSPDSGLTEVDTMSLLAALNKRAGIRSRA
jgi:hypothetical protein